MPRHYRGLHAWRILCATNLGYPRRSNANESHASWHGYQNHSSIKKQNAMKLPNMIPSLRFFDPILAIKLLMPGT